MFDDDDSGTIEIEELEKMFSYAGVADEVWRKMLKEVDDNSDGVISYEEFSDIMLKICWFRRNSFIY